jgi:hypothetical protein
MDLTHHISRICSRDMALITLTYNLILNCYYIDYYINIKSNLIRALRLINFQELSAFIKEQVFSFNLSLKHLAFSLILS